MTTEWIVEDPDFRIGADNDGQRVWMHCQVMSKKLSPSLGKRLKSGWAKGLDILKNMGAFRVFAAIAVAAPGYSHKLAVKAGMRKVHSTPALIFYCKEL